MNLDAILVFGFALVAMVYASVGFGGGSSYVAILALMALPFPEIRFTALVCNVIVVLGNSILFIQTQQLNWRKSIPIVAVSIPLAFLGARAPLHEKTFFLLLGVSLILSALLLWFQPEKKSGPIVADGPDHPVRDGLLGGGIGLLSGLVGIGGGIFLSPALHFFRWDNARKIAATASFFILVNSLAGLFGQFMSHNLSINWIRIAMLAGAVLVGGQLGLRWSFRHFSPAIVRKVTAALVFFAGLEILFKHFK